MSCKPYGFKVKMKLNKVNVVQTKLLQRNYVASWYVRHKEAAADS